MSRYSMRRVVLVAGVAIACFAGSLGAALAASEGVLQGAWTMVGTQCDDTFDMSGGKAKFRDRGASVNTGIIVRGKAFEGPISSCSVGRITQSGDQFKVRLACSDTILFSEITVTLNVLDSDHFRRFDPDFPEISVDYERCAP